MAIQPPPPTAMKIAKLRVSDEKAFVPEMDEAVDSGWHAPVGIILWIFLSNLTIILNKWIIDTAGFRYPIILTCWHFFSTSIAVQVLARTTSLLDSRHSLGMTPLVYVRTLLPIGVCYSASLVCSNIVYIYLSVAFIQMLNAANPAAVLLVSWAWRVIDPSLSAFVNMLVIVAGAALASLGEVQFSIVGLLFQTAGIILGALRLVLTQVLVSQKGMKMDPIVAIYYFGPACAAMTMLVAFVVEVPRFEIDRLTSSAVGLLLLSAVVAFALNVTTVQLIGKTSGLVMALTGIFKNILLIVVSVFIWHTHITAVQAAGYTLALVGLTYYWIGDEQLAKLYRTTSTWLVAGSGATSIGRRGNTTLVVLGGTALCIFLLSLLFSAFHHDGAANHVNVT
ncbi:hypothetical protein DCS_05020 [Drechmeria coniospora]|uniref:Sugar phosphate transporter domain-containing protein n=1 Tax=Drechmeria coniospora TaxID=98403 RepID=A0A151GLM0_DRECN|nr:hypothetical protein DCS_05020 [Drechmeria coniospora]KYK58007.1 hypothetical protein DCS_05020 [Drechmeria coniospora]